MRRLAPLLFVVTFAPGLGFAAESSGHPIEFWREIRKHDFAPPPGEIVATLLDELVANIGSPDPELRDDLGYDIAAAWIYRDQRLTDDNLRKLLASLENNLQVGIGERGTDSVLRRSFSALDLSIFAALDEKKPFLTRPEFDGLLTMALAYLGAERDLRGFEVRVGWIHATAHTADLLKFLARNSKLRPADATRILDAIAGKMETVREPFTRGEPARLARAVLSLVLRDDAPHAPLAGFVRTLHDRETALWKNGNRPDPGDYASAMNGRALLESLCILLDQQKSLTADSAALRTSILAALE